MPPRAACPNNGRILLANLLQGSRSTFLGEVSPAFLPAKKAGGCTNFGTFEFANSIRAVFVHLESSMATAIRARSGRDKGSTVPTLLTDRIRLWKAGVRDLVMELCCALHSFRVRLMPWQLMV